MTISLYKSSVPIFVQFLTSLSAVLDKAAAYAEAKKVEPSVLLNTRLAPDMFPLVRQVRMATDHAVNACGRLAGVGGRNGLKLFPLPHREGRGVGWRAAPRAAAYPPPTPPW